jgi:hypothetical protein
MKFADVKLGQVVYLIEIGDNTPMIVIDKSSVRHSQYADEDAEYVTDDGEAQVLYRDVENVIRTCWIPTHTFERETE